MRQSICPAFHFPDISTIMQYRDGRHYLSEFKGAPEAELLAVEGAKLICEIEPALASLLWLSPGQGSPTSLLDLAPVLTLQFHPCNLLRELTAADRPRILNTFARLAWGSQRLNAFLELKTAFWFDGLQSTIAQRYTHDDLRSSLRSAVFPRFVVDFASSHRICQVDEALCEDLYALMTASTSVDTRARLGEASLPPSLSAQPSVAALRLSLAECTLTPVSFDLIESFLDRMPARPNCQLALRMPDLSSYDLNAAQLAVTARAVQLTERSR